MISVLMLLFTLSASATDFSQIESDLAFLSENIDSLSPYYADRVVFLKESFDELKNSSDSDEEESRKLESSVSEIRAAFENCLNGNHSYYYVAPDCYPPLCVCYAGCDFCNYSETVIAGDGYRETHNDPDNDGICNSCQRVMPYVGCDHICHSESIIVQKMIMPILRIIWDFFDIQQFCECGTYH